MMRPHNHFEAASNWYISLFFIGLLLFSPLAEAQSVNIDPLVQALRGRQGALVYENAKDAAGNVISRTSNGKSYRYVFDEENRLTEVWEGSAKKIEMAYGYAGNRIRKEVDLGAGRKIRTTYLGSVQIHESVVNGTVTERSVTTHIAAPTGKFLTSTRGTLGNNQQVPLRGPAAGDHYFINDHLGSQVRELDASGNVVSTSVYEPYGQLFIQGQSGSSGRQQNYGYTGQELDEFGGIMYYGARFFDPAAGRFMSADKMLADAKNAMAWNPTMYVLGNPIGLNDPTGNVPGMAGMHNGYDKFVSSGGAYAAYKDCTGCAIGAAATALPLMIPLALGATPAIAAVTAVGNSPALLSGTMTLLDFAAPAGALGGLGTVMGKYVQELKAVNILEMLGSRLGRGGRGVAFNVMGDLNFAIKLGTERDIGRQVQMLQAFGSRLKAAGIEQLRAATAMRGTDKNGRAFALLEKVEGEVLGETGFANLKHTEELADLMTDFFSRSGSEVGRMLGDNLRPAISYSLKTGRGFFGLSGDVVRSTDKAGKNIYTVIDPSGSNILGQ